MSAILGKSANQRDVEAGAMRRGCDGDGLGCFQNFVDSEQRVEGMNVLCTMYSTS